MVRRAWRAAGDADMTVLLVDAARRPGAREADIVAGLKAGGRQAVLALNKIDLIARERLLARADRLYATGCFSDVFMVSALTGDGVDDLLAHLSGAPAGRPLALSRGRPLRRAAALPRRRDHAREAVPAPA